MWAVSGEAVEEEVASMPANSHRFGAPSNPWCLIHLEGADAAACTRARAAALECCPPARHPGPLHRTDAITPAAMTTPTMASTGRDIRARVVENTSTTIIQTRTDS